MTQGEIEQALLEYFDKLNVFGYSRNSKGFAYITDFTFAQVEKADRQSREECARIAEEWPCTCSATYKGTKDYHGPDCEAELGKNIADTIRATISK